MDVDKQKAGPGLAGLLKKRCCQIVSWGRQEKEGTLFASLLYEMHTLLSLPYYQVL